VDPDGNDVAGDPVVHGLEDVQVEGTETSVQKMLGLKGYLPQVISECLSV
jgi:hypothetical protein